MDEILAKVNTFNCGQKLGCYLESIKWVDKIVVIDSENIDVLVEIIKGHTSKYFHFSGFLRPGISVGWKATTRLIGKNIINTRQRTNDISIGNC